MEANWHCCFCFLKNWSKSIGGWDNCCAILCVVVLSWEWVWGNWRGGWRERKLSVEKNLQHKVFNLSSIPCQSHKMNHLLHSSPKFVGRFWISLFFENLYWNFQSSLNTLSNSMTHPLHLSPKFVGSFWISLLKSSCVFDYI